MGAGGQTDHVYKLLEGAGTQGDPLLLGLRGGLDAGAEEPGKEGSETWGPGTSLGSSDCSGRVRGDQGHPLGSRAAHKVLRWWLPAPEVFPRGHAGLLQGRTVSGASTRGCQACWFRPFCSISMQRCPRTHLGGFFFPIPGSTREVKGWLEVSGRGVGVGAGSQPGLLGYSNILQHEPAWGRRGGGQVGVILVIQSPDNGWLTEVKGLHPHLASI